MDSNNLKIRQYSVWTLSNILVGNEKITMQMFADTLLIEKLIKLIVVDNDLVGLK